MADEQYSFGAWMRVRRQALVLSRDDLARQVGVAEVSLRKIEADERRPSPQVAVLLAQHLQLAPEQQMRFVQVARGVLAVDQLPPPIPGASNAPRTDAAPAAVPALPSGTVTFLFTDIAGSTKLWEQHSQAMRVALARHDAILRQVIGAHGGVIFKTVGDAVCAVFGHAPTALAAALAAQRALHAETWGATGPLAVRMALHTGAAEERDGDYFGPPLNRVARLLAVGHGGQILLSLATNELVREQLPLEAEPRDLGVHRLKDLSRPEQIFQLVAPDLPTDFPPLNTLEMRRTNLPAQPTALIGRAQEIAELCALLRRPELRLLTLTGPGGAGKTRLGLQVAAELVSDFTHGVVFVNLAPISDLALVASSIAQALDITAIGDQALLERLRSYLYAKQLVLLLDNFEQVVDAAPLLAELLASCPQLKIIVTSRVPLHLRGEQEFPVPPLALPPASDGRYAMAATDQWMAVTQYAAVALFIQCAREVQPGFAVTNATAPAIAEICYRLDGLPLAIELAAARIKLFTPIALLARLNSGLTLLTGGARDLPQRQQTLRNAIAWSYDLLDADTQTLFARLAIFVGGGTLEAAEAVCGAWTTGAGGGGVPPTPVAHLPTPTLEGLARLVDHSLLRQEAGEEPRFLMLETIREYAFERLEASGAAGALRQRHADYFLALAEAAEAKLRGREQALWSARLEGDLDNLRAAMGWAIASDRHAIAARIATALQQFWLVHGLFAEELRWLDAALATPALPPAIRAKALESAAHRRNHSSGCDAALPFFAEALALYQQLGDRSGIMRCSAHIAQCHDDFVAARAALEAGLARFRAEGDRQLIADTLCFLGYVALDQRDHAAARARLEEFLAIARELEYQLGMAIAFLGLGILAQQQGDYATRRTWEEQRLAISYELHDVGGIAGSQYNIGVALMWQGDADEAASRITEAQVIYQDMGLVDGHIEALDGLGHVALMQADYGTARARFEECLALQRQLAATQGIAGTLHWLAHVAIAESDLGQAAALLGECIGLLRPQHDQRVLRYALEGCAELALARGLPERAARLCGAASALRIDMVDFYRYSFPDERQRSESLLAATRAQLSPAAFDAAWAAGHALTPAQAIAEARGEADHGAPSAPDHTSAAL